MLFPFNISLSLILMAGPIVSAMSSHAAPRSMISTSRTAFLDYLSKPDTPTSHAAPRSHPRSFDVQEMKRLEEAEIKRRIPIEERDDCTPPSYFNDVPLQSFADYDAGKAVLFRYRQQQSVNLGSLFLHEAWMVPSLFKCAAWPQGSEIDIVKGWGSVDGARQVLEQHWDTFITEDDIAYLASVGINTVRLPIGYWSLGSDFCKGTSFAPYAAAYANAWPRVVKMINIAAKYNIGVLIDLHGAPGSQNGQDIAGTSDGRMNLFYDEWNIKKAMKVLTFLSSQLANVTNIVGIQILNEPKGVKSLEAFYDRAITAMRSVSDIAKSLPLYIHDGFDLNRFTTYISNRPDFVVLDHHAYYVYTDEDAAQSVTSHTNDINSQVSADLTYASSQMRRNIVIDEWSSAVTPNSLSQESNKAGAQKAYGISQESVYRRTTAGWAFWSYDMENCGTGWCFKAAIGVTLPPIFPSFGTDTINLVNISSDLQGRLSSIPVPSVTDILGKNIYKRSDEAPATPSTWFAGFESYASFHARYKSFGCKGEQGSPFWSACCHPLLSNETSVNLPTECASKLHTLTRRGDTMNDVSSVSWAGFKDGFTIATSLGNFGLSKLGFTGQFGMDQLSSRLAAGNIPSGYTDTYYKFLYQGISAGESAVIAVANK